VNGPISMPKVNRPPVLRPYQKTPYNAKVLELNVNIMDGINSFKQASRGHIGLNGWSGTSSDI
jgi:hypothetical protein